MSRVYLPQDTRAPVQRSAELLNVKTLLLGFAAVCHCVPIGHLSGFVYIDSQMLIGFMSLIGSVFVWVDIQCAKKYYVPAFAH